MQRLVLRLDGWDQGSHYPHGHLVRVLGPINSLRCECQRAAAAIRATALSCASNRCMRLAQRLIHSYGHCTSLHKLYSPLTVFPQSRASVLQLRPYLNRRSPLPSLTHFSHPPLSPIPPGRSETDGVLVSSGVHWQPFRWAREGPSNQADRECRADQADMLPSALAESVPALLRLLSHPDAALMAQPRALPTPAPLQRGRAA